jgi:hypothetical protein
MNPHSCMLTSTGETQAGWSPQSRGPNNRRRLQLEMIVLGAQFVVSWNAAKTNQYADSHASIFRFAGSLSKDDPTLHVQRGLSRKTWPLSLSVSA